jgi:hypothetical protein
VFIISVGSLLTGEARIGFSIKRGFAAFLSGLSSEGCLDNISKRGLAFDLVSGGGIRFGICYIDSSSLEQISSGDSRISVSELSQES